MQAGVHLSEDVGLLLNICVSGCVSGSVREARAGDKRMRERHVGRASYGGHVRNVGGDLGIQEGHV